MKTNIFLIHGAYGNPTENWFPWLKEKLEQENIEVFIPSFPTPENQNLASWRGVFKDYLPHVHEGSIFIGHSLGPAFILDILEHLPDSVAGALFVAPFVGKLNNPAFDNINKTIADRNFQWQSLRKKSKKFFCYYSNNDPYVPQENSISLANHLDATKIEIKNGDHINKEAGFETASFLWEDLKNLIF